MISIIEINREADMIEFSIPSMEEVEVEESEASYEEIEPSTPEPIIINRGPDKKPQKTIST